MNLEKSVLVVDDSPTQIALLRDSLEDRGFVVETASNGVEAISKVYQMLPRLVLSDIMMPELNGYHLCRLLKNDPTTAQIPVILLTNLSEEHDRFWGKNAGADLYLEKTSDREVIAGAVENLLSLTPRPCQPSAPGRNMPVQKEDIQARITSILDRLLYESTISNEILKFTSLTHDVKALSRELLTFIKAICRHDAAGLLLRQSREKMVLAFTFNEEMPINFIASAKEMMSSEMDGDSENQLKTQILLFPESPPLNPDLSPDFQIFHTLPIQDGHETFGLICLFNKRPRALTEGIHHALTLVAERFLIVARYLNKLNEIEEVKADFISMLVHDLRSPLTSIRGFSEVLSKGMLGPVNEDQKSALENVQGGSDRLLSLIEDILHLSKLEAGKMSLTPTLVNVAKLAEDSVRDLAALFLERKIDVKIDVSEDLPTILADGHQLSRVLANLLTNAAKFSPREGQVRLRISAVHSSSNADGPDLIRVNVEDEGPGIPAEQQPILFSRYQQVGLKSPKMRKGTGLGLAICKEIIHLHDGKIWVESPIKEESGSRFSFTVPLNSA